MEPAMQPVACDTIVEKQPFPRFGLWAGVHACCS